MPLVVVLPFNSSPLHWMMENGCSCCRMQGRGKVIGGVKTMSTLTNLAAYFIALHSICGGYKIPRAIEAPEKSSLPLEARRMVLRGDSSGLAMTMGFVMVYTAAAAPSEGVNIVATVLDVLKESVVIVVGDNGEIEEIRGSEH
ncbi:hypothetical protein ARMGADRAFT_1036510 [Armillaria gallica]|uniref:Uncharacterized protein n=1 Tax=Armillaria gallica TaxID=47427 RepID=A0A2H3CQ93_ARMGA|nr:hypothetical protein ARMGADRAFT_1036510 [Armillaria gallica]